MTHTGDFWAVPKQRSSSFPQGVAQFGRFYFRGLGGPQLAYRLVVGGRWESQPIGKVIEQMGAAIEEEAPLEFEWKATYKVPSLSASTAYYAGETPFHPTAIWNERSLASNLNSEKWHVEPSRAESPTLTKHRTFIEVFPWTEEDDLLKAFRQTRQFADKLLPRNVRTRRDISVSLKLYQAYVDGESLEDLLAHWGPTADERSLRRHVNEIAQLLGLPKPQRKSRGRP